MNNILKKTNQKTVVLVMMTSPSHCWVADRSVEFPTVYLLDEKVHVSNSFVVIVIVIVIISLQPQRISRQPSKMKPNETLPVYIY